MNVRQTNPKYDKIRHLQACRVLRMPEIKTQIDGLTLQISQIILAVRM